MDSSPNQNFKRTALGHSRVSLQLTHPCPTGANYLALPFTKGKQICYPQGEKTILLSQVVYPINTRKLNPEEMHGPALSFMSWFENHRLEIALLCLQCTEELVAGSRLPE